MFTIVYTDSSNDDFKVLSAALEQELFERDGDMAEGNYELNKADHLDNTVALYLNGTAVGCGAFRIYLDDVIELKRMYVIPSQRKNNIGSRILSALEGLARNKGFNKAVLETGKNQPEAIAFYLKHGYVETERFGIYEKSENSVCFEKLL